MKDFVRINSKVNKSKNYPNLKRPFSIKVFKLMDKF